MAADNTVILHNTTASDDVSSAAIKMQPLPVLASPYVSNKEKKGTVLKKGPSHLPKKPLMKEDKEEEEEASLLGILLFPSGQIIFGLLPSPSSSSNDGVISWPIVLLVSKLPFTT